MCKLSTDPEYNYQVRRTLIPIKLVHCSYSVLVLTLSNSSLASLAEILLLGCVSNIYSHHIYS